jgi:CRISPR-associated protein Csx10
MIIAKRASAGNQFRTQLAIPGKTLRGALAARAAQRFDLGHGSTYETFVDLFLRGSVHFPVLYPLQEVEDEVDQAKHPLLYPASPVPRDGFGCKVYPEHPLQWGTQKGTSIQICSKCQKPVKAVRGAFLSMREPLERFEPDTSSEMHIRVDPETGRVEEGQLFEYEALDAGQYFMGELTCADQEAWGLLQTLADLKEESSISIRLGKATRRGYGQVTLWFEPRTDQDVQPWIQQGIGHRVSEGNDELTLTLLTDTIVADGWGRFVTGFDEACDCGKDTSDCRCKCDWLSRALGFDVQVVSGRSFAATHVVDGFNTKLRLPRWRDVALESGSTVRLRVLEAPDEGLLAALRRVEREGIGLRRSEGYGRVVFNHPAYGYGDGRPDSPVSIPTELRLISGEPVTEFEDKWRQALDREEGRNNRPWSQCRDQRFLGLARWLDAHRLESIDQLMDKLDMLCEPGEQVVDAGGAGLIEDIGDRGIANPLTGKKCFDLVRDILRLLQEEDEIRWPLGIRMLADRLAEAAGEEEGRWFIA